MKTEAIGLVALGMLVMPLTVWAGGQSGFYVGAGGGQSSMEADATNPSGSFNFDDSATGYKVIVGYNFGIIPLLDLGVEGSYVDFGKISGTSALGSSEAKAKGYDAFAVGALTFGPFAVFAKAGAIQWDTDVTLGGTVSSDSGTDAAYGVGVRFQLSSFSLRAEYEVFDVSSLKDLSMASVSVLYTF